VTISAGASTSAGHHRIYSLGGFHQLQTEITVSWAQLTTDYYYEQLPAAARRKELWFSTKTKRSPLSGRQGLHH